MSFTKCHNISYVQKAILKLLAEISSLLYIVVCIRDGGYKDLKNLLEFTYILLEIILSL